MQYFKKCILITALESISSPTPVKIHLWELWSSKIVLIRSLTWVCCFLPTSWYLVQVLTRSGICIICSPERCQVTLWTLGQCKFTVTLADLHSLTDLKSPMWCGYNSFHLQREKLFTTECQRSPWPFLLKEIEMRQKFPSYTILEHHLTRDAACSNKTDSVVYGIGLTAWHNSHESISEEKPPT